MTVNDPTLPLTNALQTTLATLIGLALALAPGRIAASRPADLLWLALDGTALALVTPVAVGLQQLDRWLEGSATCRIRLMLGAAAAAVVGPLIVTALRTGHGMIAGDR